MPALVGHMAALVDGLDVASAGELRGRARCRHRPARRSASPARARPKPSSRRRSPPASWSTSSRRARSSCSRGCRARTRPAGARRSARQSRLRAEVLGHEDGRRAEAVRRRCRARAGACSREIGRLGPRLRRLSHLRGLAEPAAEAICEAQQKPLELALAARRQRRPAPVRVLNIGGGFGIPYFPGEQPLDLAPIGANLARARRPAPRQRCREAELVIELGPLSGRRSRHLRLPRRSTARVSRGQVFLVTDGGLHHHLAASGNFGQVIRKNYPVAIGNRMRGAAATSSRRSSGRCAPGFARRRCAARRPVSRGVSPICPAALSESMFSSSCRDT